MRKYILLILLALLQLNCDQISQKNDLLGLWCNDQFCLYFAEEVCNIYSARFQKYTVSGDLITQESGTELEPFETEFDYRIKKDTFFVKMVDDLRFYSYVRPKEINEKPIDKIYYALDAENSSYDLILETDGAIEINIIYDDRLESNSYKGNLRELKPVYIEKLLEQLKTISLNVKPELDLKIVSDIQEWAMILVDEEGKKYSLYYNYEEISSAHHCLAFSMEVLPRILDENDLILSAELSENKARAFKEKEFKRNLEMLK